MAGSSAGHPKRTPFLLFALVFSPVGIAWLSLLIFAAAGLFAIFRTRGWGRVAGAGVLLLVFAISADVLMRPEAEDAVRERRLAELAALPRHSLPNNLPSALVLRGFEPREVLAVAQRLSTDVILQWGDRAQLFSTRTVIECPYIVKPRPPDMEIPRASCPPMVHIPMPVRYLFLLNDSSEKDRDIGIISTFSLLLVEEDEQSLIQSVPERARKTRRLLDRLMGIFWELREKAQICFEGTWQAGPFEADTFLARVLRDGARLDHALCPG
jgi:hypothetical protein